MQNYNKGRYSSNDIGMLLSRNNRNPEEWQTIAIELNRTLESVRSVFLKYVGHSGDIPDTVHCNDCLFNVSKDTVLTSDIGTIHCVRCKGQNLTYITNAKKLIVDSLYQMEQHPSCVSWEDSNYNFI